MLKIFVVASCEMDGITSDPFTPKILLPVRIFPATQSVTLVRLTVPPLVYPAGMLYVPALVPIVPPVAPLLAIEPLTEPLEP